jgi:uncharacterized membrane protein
MRNNTDTIFDGYEQQDSIRVLKLRLAKGEIDKKEYQELYNGLFSLAFL